MNSIIYKKLEEIDFQFREEINESNDYCVVAQIMSYEKEKISGNYFHFTGLIDIEKYYKLRSNKIYFNVNTSGPHSFYEPNWKYAPKFWIWSIIDEKEYRIEPLIVSWENNRKTILLVDQGFLMTYGLVPRYIDENEIIWDEPSLPDEKVVISSLFSNYDLLKHSTAHVKIKKKYLQDYATLRKKAIIKIFYETSNIKRGFMEINKDKHYKKILKRTNYWLKYNKDGDYAVIDIEGFRLFVKPGKAPISDEWGKKEALLWPNYDKPIINNEALSFMMFDFAYINDSVLDIYEKNDDKYIVSPESCSVWYGNQWAVICSGRINRHVIMVELKKLYEGVPFEVTKHWNEYAVKEPKNIVKDIDIGSKSKKLVHAYVQFGEYLAYHLGRILKKADIIPEQITNINEHTFYHDYWAFLKQIKPITYHIPSNFNEKDFFERCKLLSQLIIEPLPEKILRNALVNLDVLNDTMKNFRSLLLLNVLLKYFFFAQNIGLNLMDNIDIEIMAKRIDSEYDYDPIEPLIQLNKFRKLDAHNISTSEKNTIIESGYKIFKTQTDFKKYDYESAIEKVYDTLTDTFEKCNSILKQSIT